MSCRDWEQEVRLIILVVQPIFSLGTNHMACWFFHLFSIGLGTCVINQLTFTILKSQYNTNTSHLG